MLRFSSFLIILLCLAVAVTCADNYRRSDFPSGFIFGAGTSAYQVEGAAKEDGRSPSVWDTFAYEGNIFGGVTGDVAVDQYHKYKEDVKLMVATGLDAYRFSISWSRLIPNGREPVNPKGLQYYNNLIDELVNNGIQPHVTLLNYDHPQALEDEYGGWVSRKIVKDFTEYADVCFREFGDRVSHWATINEPNIFAYGGYDVGSTPPKRCSAPFGVANCSKGDSSLEPYLAAHHMLLAHASAAKLYKRKYQVKQHGFIGLTLNAIWYVPLTNSKEDEIATQRMRDFFLGWNVNPLVFGDYPEIMKKNVGTRLPTFTSHESKLVRGSFDFIGVIHYVTLYVKDNPNALNQENRDFTADAAVTVLFDKENEPPSSFEFPMRPWGLQGLLEYFKQAYGNPPMFVHENGQITLYGSPLEDVSRVTYLHAYMGSLLDVIRNGSNTKGYFVWSFLDVLELIGGYEVGYGLYHVDWEDPDLKRQPRLSAHWYSQFLKGKTASLDGILELEKQSSAFLRGHSFQ
uniref:Beta-glucosidase 11-like n=2 Tax=Rhizophora mucronata TaxID=61149 RepID=A0A2P2LXX8_RHIMU